MGIQRILIAGCAATLLAGAANAVPVTYNFDVLVTSTNNVAGGPEGLYLGSTGSGSLTFESSTPFDFVPVTALSLAMNFGSFAQTFTEQDDFAFNDVFFPGPNVQLGATGAEAEALFFTVFDDDITTFPAVENIIDAPNIVDFSMLALFDTNENGDPVYGMEVQTDNLSPIPVPASFPLLFAGVALFGAMKRKSRKS